MFARYNEFIAGENVSYGQAVTASVPQTDLVGIERDLGFFVRGEDLCALTDQAIRRLCFLYHSRS